MIEEGGVVKKGARTERTGSQSGWLLRMRIYDRGVGLLLEWSGSGADRGFGRRSDTGGLSVEKI